MMTNQISTPDFSLQNLVKLYGYVTFVSKEISANLGRDRLT